MSLNTPHPSFSVRGTELHEIAGRTFALTPEEEPASGSSWTFMEVLADGSVVEPDDLMGCHAGKSFVLFHIRSSLGLR
jgi:hypothetical protein